MGSTLIFSYISWLGPFLVQKFEFQYFWYFFFFFFFGGGGGRGGHEDFVDIFGVIVKLEYFRVSFLCTFFSSEYLWQVCTFESRLSLRHCTKTSRAGSNACFILFM